MPFIIHNLQSLSCFTKLFCNVAKYLRIGSSCAQTFRQHRVKDHWGGSRITGVVVGLLGWWGSCWGGGKAGVVGCTLSS